jgi:hypothetical protein
MPYLVDTRFLVPHDKSQTLVLVYFPKGILSVCFLKGKHLVPGC